MTDSPSTSPPRKKPLKDLVRVVVVGLFFVAAAFALKHPAVREQLLDVDMMRSELQDGGVRNSLIFMGIAALINALGVPRIWVCGIAGSLFGAAEGILVGYGATLLGSSINFLMGRSLLRGPIKRNIPSRLQPWYRAFNRHGFKAILYLRLFPLANATLTNLMGGASRMTYRDFILATAIGFLPFTIAFATLGSSAAKQNPWQLAGGLALFAAVALGQWLWTRMRRNQPDLTESGENPVINTETTLPKGSQDHESYSR